MKKTVLILIAPLGGRCTQAGQHSWQLNKKLKIKYNK